MIRGAHPRRGLRALRDRRLRELSLMRLSPNIITVLALCAGLTAIRFGSRTDLYLPPNVQPLVCEGQRMVGGETVVADLTSTEPARRGASR